jgi:arylsulfatase A
MMKPPRTWMLIVLLAALSLYTATAATKPNVIVILADDLGWTDLGCFGSDYYQTPNIDKLAKDGMRFTQNYSACTVCSPTRAALLTGKYPARLHVTDWIPGRPPGNPKLLVPDWTKFLSLNEPTFADAFKAAGYTTASIGKWHLGGEAYYPDKHGFDINVAGTEAGSPLKGYFAPYQISTLAEGPKGEYLTDRMGAEAVRFVEQHKDKPFCLYLPHFAVHTPIQAKQAVVDKYRNEVKSGKNHQNPVYAAMVESMDDAVGMLRRKLEESKLSEQTIIIFTSDNGGHLPTTSNVPLRVGKGSCYEGGTRVPMIVYWPGVTKAGSLNETPVISMDIYPTILEMAGVKDVVGHKPDGVSLVPLLRQGGSLKRDALFWHYPHYQLYQQGGTKPYSAVRKGDFKLLEFHDDMRVELYDLKNDIGELNDLAMKMPEKRDELRKTLHAWRREVGAQMPARNPAYDASQPEYTPPAKKQRK